MRRKGVPCGCTDNGGCCGLKEKLAILWDRTIGSILKINDQTPDGDGNFEIRAGSNVTISDISNGIEISATGGSAEDAVKSVNGELPDEDGEVTVDVGVKTVNTIAPDSDGDFTISAGTNVTITPTTNGVEIEAEGGSPEVVSPLYIDGDGKIALKDWTLVADKNWAKYAPNNVAITDLYIIVNNSSGLNGETFVPKGGRTGTLRLDLTGSVSGNIYQYIAPMALNNVINDNANISPYRTEMNVTTGGSGADQYLSVSLAYSYPSIPKVFNDSGNGVRLYVRELVV